MLEIVRPNPNRTIRNWVKLIGLFNHFENKKQKKDQPRFLPSVESNDVAKVQWPIECDVDTAEKKF